MQEQPSQPTPPQEPKPQPLPNPPEEKLEYLKREEVRTMEKDIARLREEEAKKEQARIAQLEAQKELEKEKGVIQKVKELAVERKIRGEQEEQKIFQKIKDSILPPGEESPIQNLPSPPSSFQKIFVRLFFVVLFSLIAFYVTLFGYWYLVKKIKAPEPSSPPTLQPSLPVPVSPEPQPPQPPLPPAISTLKDTVAPQRANTLQFTAKEDLAHLFSLFSQKEQQPGFAELIFRKQPGGLAISREELFELFGVSIPASVSSQFQEDFLLFLYSYEQKNRLGFVSKVKDGKLAKEAMRQWEKTVEQDLLPLSPLLGTEGTWYIHSFLSRTYKDTEIRLQTFSLQDIGIVYAVLDDYLIFTSSFEAAKAAIDRLAAPVAFHRNPLTLAVLETLEVSGNSSPNWISQILLIGFEGTSLTPQLEQLIEYLRPGGVLLLSQNIEDALQLKNLIADLQAASLRYSSIPLFIAVDQEGGTISRIGFATEKTPQAAIQTGEQAYQVGKARGEELKALGVNLNLSPVLDAARPGDFIFERTFQTEPALAASLAKSLTTGYKDAGILSSLKHFPGYGNIAFDPEKKLTVVKELPDISSFSFALSAKPEFLLISNVIYQSLNKDKPFPFSQEGTGLIRSSLAYDGIILSDDLSQPSLREYYTLKDITLSPLLAGVNMMIFSKADEALQAHEILLKESQYDNQLRRAVEESAAKILDLKKNFFSLSPSL